MLLLTVYGNQLRQQHRGQVESMKQSARHDVFSLGHGRRQLDLIGSIDNDETINKAASHGRHDANYNRLKL